MNHDRVKRLLPAFADHHMGFVRRLFLAPHIASCPSCQTELEVIHTMRTALRTTLPTYRAPPALALRIASALPRETPPPKSRQPFYFGRLSTGMAAGFAGVALTLAVTRFTPIQIAPASDPLIAEVVAADVRSQMADHLTDVATSDQHTVKPWLSARLDLSPVVKDFIAEGYPLVGGRLDYIDGHRAAAIVYRRDKHVINLFVFASADRSDTPPKRESLNGFNTVRWRMGGLTYVAVSDVEATQLDGFVRLVSNG
jgi:anti-sigma factor RsiW